jgi:hypothetical protein
LELCGRIEQRVGRANLECVRAAAGAVDPTLKLPSQRELIQGDRPCDIGKPRLLHDQDEWITHGAAEAEAPALSLGGWTHFVFQRLAGLIERLPPSRGVGRAATAQTYLVHRPIGLD